MGFVAMIRDVLENGLQTGARCVRERGNRKDHQSHKHRKNVESHSHKRNLPSSQRRNYDLHQLEGQEVISCSRKRD